MMTSSAPTGCFQLRGTTAGWQSQFLGALPVGDTVLV
jgi:hypothetical protein